jgi:hypothetical protein
MGVQLNFLLLTVASERDALSPFLFAVAINELFLTEVSKENPNLFFHFL